MTYHWISVIEKRVGETSNLFLTVTLAAAVLLPIHLLVTFTTSPKILFHCKAAKITGILIQAKLTK